jgi:hypothetical protein
MNPEPMHEPDPRQAIIDDEHLRLLAIGYVVSGVMTALVSMFGLLYAGMGLLIGSVASHAAQAGADGPPPEIVGWVFAVFGGLFFLFAGGLALAKFMTASRLKARRGRMFCQVVAAFTCFGIPWGTLLGVATFIVLSRASVERRFDAPAP